MEPTDGCIQSVQPEIVNKINDESSTPVRLRAQVRLWRFRSQLPSTCILSKRSGRTPLSQNLESGKCQLRRPPLAADFFTACITGSGAGSPIWYERRAADGVAVLRFSDSCRRRRRADQRLSRSEGIVALEAGSWRAIHADGLCPRAGGAGVTLDAAHLLGIVKAMG